MTGLTFSPPADVRVSIIIPVYNGLTYTRQCLEAVREVTGGSYEMIVVDNASTDGTGEFLVAIEGITVVTNSENLGFAKACNIGARRARGEFLLFLNNDTEPAPGWLERMLETAERRERVGAVGSRLLFPSALTVQHAGVLFNEERLPYHIFRHHDGNSAEVLGEREVPAVTGACLLTPRALFSQAGEFNEEYVNGLEDIDYCLVLREMGWKSWYNGGSLLLHHESMTQGRLCRASGDANLALFRSRWEHLIEPDNPVDAIGPGTRNTPFRRYLAGQSPLLYGTGSMERQILVCRPGEHIEGHCVYGPGLLVLASQKLRANFYLQVDKSADPHARAVSLDIYDNIAGQILAHRVVTAGEIKESPYGQVVEHEVERGGNLEFRAYWHGEAEVRFSHLTLLFADV